MNSGQRQLRHKELSSEDAIAAAKSALRKQQDFRFGNTKLESEFMDFDLITAAERLFAVEDALSSIRPEDRLGPQPPNNISVPPYAGEPLYAFIWKSETFGSVYLKFCLTGTSGLELLVLHSFHAEREQK